MFSDYARPAIRLSALMELPVIHIFTHDSIGLGEDGPTHQPVEHLASLRAIPGLNVIRPCDANEVAEAWRVAMDRRHGPVALVLTRQDVPILDRDRYASAEGLRRGGYVLADPADGDPELILIATGSEVALAVEAYEELAADGVRARVVSLPSFHLFDRQPDDYRESVLPAAVTARVGIEEASTFGWDRYVGPEGAMIGMHTFGSSAPLKDVLGKFGFTPERVVQTAREVLSRSDARRKRMKPTARLHELGQSLWIDNITRTMLDDGTLARYIDELSVTGLTSNPTIFDKAIGAGDAYDEQIAELQQHGMEGEELFFELALTDLRRAAELFAPINRRTDDVDGWVSLEVSPLIADDAEATIAQASDLHARAECNVYIKIPGTEAGRTAIEESIFAGVPINVTLLFSTRALPGRGGRVHARRGAPDRGRARPSRAVGRIPVPQPLGRRGRRPGARRASQPARDRRRQAGLPRLPRAARLGALAAARQRGRAAAAPALGEHGTEGPGGLGRALHRGPGGAR